MLPVYTQVRTILIECGDNFVPNTHNKSMTIDEISINSKISRDNVYNILKGLDKYNLIFCNFNNDLIKGISLRGTLVYCACKDFYVWLGTEIKSDDIEECIIQTCKYAEKYIKKINILDTYNI